MILSSSIKKKAAAGIAILAWVSLALQFYLILQTTGSTGFSTFKTVTNFFSYFTILSNLLVAISLTALLIKKSGCLGTFFRKTSVQSAIAVYIFIVALVYNTVLRGMLSLNGIDWIVDNLLHVIVPVLYVFYWCIFTPAKVLSWKNIAPWLTFPTLFLAYSMIRGSIVNWYPYPFLNAARLGYGQVAINSFIVLLAFITLSIAAIAFNKRGKLKES